MMMMGFMEILLLLGTNSGQILDVVGAEQYWALHGVTATVESMEAQLAEPDYATAVPELLKGFAEAPEALGPFGSSGMKPSLRIAVLGKGALPVLEKLAEGEDPPVGIDDAMLAIEEMPAARSVHRLMAIRTLGELGQAEGLEALTPLLESEAMFEADFARQAIARIKGEGLPARKVNRDASTQDIATMPDGLGMILQVLPGSGRSSSLEEVLKQLPMSGPHISEEMKKQMVEMMTMQVLHGVYAIGNARLDSLSLGLSEEIDSNAGYIVVKFSGLYDPDNIRALLEAHAPVDAPEEPETIEGLAVYRPDAEFALVMPSEKELILVAGPREQELPIAAVLKARQADAPAGENTGDLQKLFADLPKGARFRLAALVTDGYANDLQLIAPFESATIVATSEDGVLKGEAKLAGGTAEEAKMTVEEIQNGIDQMKEGLEAAAEMMPIPKAKAKKYAAALEALEVTPEGGTVTLAGQFEGSPADLVSMFFVGMMTRHSAPSGPVAPPTEPPPAGSDF